MVSQYWLKDKSAFLFQRTSLDRPRGVALSPGWWSRNLALDVTPVYHSRNTQVSSHLSFFSSIHKLSSYCVCLAWGLILRPIPPLKSQRLAQDRAKGRGLAKSHVPDERKNQIIPNKGDQEGLGISSGTLLGIEASIMDLLQFSHRDEIWGFSTDIESGHWAHWMWYNVNETVMCYWCQSQNR